jgi:hypothetical protein
MRTRAGLAVLAVFVLALVACAKAPDLPANDAASYEVLTGSNGQDFLREISSEDWNDGGRAAAQGLSWIAQEANSTDGPTARRAAEAAHAIAVFLAGDKGELLRLSSGWFGLQHRSLGELNPELVRGYASALTPFQGALIGDVESERGFEIIGNGADVSAARDVFAVIDTDTQAADQFKEAAYQRIKGYLHSYAEAVVRGERDRLVDLQHAAELAGVVEGGQRDSGNEAIETTTAQFWINWAGYEIAAAHGARPGTDGIPTEFFDRDGLLKSPDDVTNNDLPRYATAVANFSANHGQGDLGADFRRWYEDAAGK